MRRILHHGSDPSATPTELQDRVIAGCWFELHRQGGCGAGEVVLKDAFPLRDAIDIGDWFSFEWSPGERWYLGRVEERRAVSPAEIRLRLEGMSVELGEVFPGGFGSDAGDIPPHRYAATDLFSHDPDRDIETWDSVDAPDSLVSKLIEQYVAPATHIAHNPTLIEPPAHPASVTSLKFRGEESVRAIVKEAALRAQANWGVDAAGDFFFLQQRSDELATWREGRDLVSMHETRDREHLFNRVLLTGDYVYDVLDSSAHIARRSYRWRGNYVQPASREQYGDRRIRLWIPWLRTEEDSLTFVREFFRVYSQPTSRFLIETLPQSSLPLPWAGRVRLEDRDGAPLVTAAIESIRVAFDHAPRFRLELGPEDPRNLWPEPPHDERWELPQGRTPGGGVSLTDLSSEDATSESGLTSGDDSDASSGESSGQSTGVSTAGSSGEVSSLETNPTSHSGSSSGANGSSDDDSSDAWSWTLSDSIDSFSDDSSAPDSTAESNETGLGSSGEESTFIGYSTPEEPSYADSSSSTESLDSEPVSGGSTDSA